MVRGRFIRCCSSSQAPSMVGHKGQERTGIWILRKPKEIGPCRQGKVLPGGD